MRTGFIRGRSFSTRGEADASLLSPHGNQQSSTNKPAANRYRPVFSLVQMVKVVNTPAMSELTHCRRNGWDRSTCQAASTSGTTVRNAYAVCSDCHAWLKSTIKPSAPRMPLERLVRVVTV